VITPNQMPQRFQDVIGEQVDVYEAGTTIQAVSEIPETSKIPIQNPKHWLRIADVICVYVDMVNSTGLSAVEHDRNTASAYQLFTNTAVRLFHAFEAPYIDVRGDGAFALFNADQPYRAIAAAVTVKTFAKEVFVPKLHELTDVDLGAHIGIDQNTVLVRKVGLKQYGNRSDRQNEVWAGKPVNMAAKLSSLAKANELIVSDRYFACVQDDYVVMSCGCENGGTGGKSRLWEEIDVTSDPRFDFAKAHLLKSVWCARHGLEYCEAILTLDEET